MQRKLDIRSKCRSHHTIQEDSVLQTLRQYNSNQQENVAFRRRTVQQKRRVLKENNSFLPQIQPLAPTPYFGIKDKRPYEFQGLVYKRKFL